jgi:shikimate kinase
MPAAPGVRFVVLVGLPGSGKSTLAPLVAARLGWGSVDLDALIAESAGRSVPAIFEREGEPGFRARERDATAAVAHSAPLVLAVGGGWMLDPANLALLGDGVRSVYLRVSPELAVARMGADLATRPLLRGADPVARLGELLEARESAYLHANHTLAVDSMTADAAADIIVALASRPAGD